MRTTNRGVVRIDLSGIVQNSDIQRRSYQLFAIMFQAITAFSLASAALCGSDFSKVSLREGEEWCAHDNGGTLTALRRASVRTCCGIAASHHPAVPSLGRIASMKTAE
jgi:hypothetical protein